MKWRMGVDAGSKNGSICLLRDDGEQAIFFDITGAPLEIKDHFREIVQYHKVEFAVLENPGHRPFQNPSAGDKLHDAVGYIRCLLDWLDIPYKFVTPPKWQAVVEGIPGAKPRIKVDKKTMTPEQIAEIKKKNDKLSSERKKEVKEAVQLFVRRRFPHAEVKNNFNRSDALAIAYYASKELQD